MEINKIYNEDCLETLKRLPDNSIDLLLQDPPFGVTQNEWDIKPNLQTMWQEWNRVSKDNTAMIFFATQPFASELILSNRTNFRYDIIWYKALGTGFLNANKMPMRNHEHILLFYRKLPTYIKIEFFGNEIESVAKLEYMTNQKISKLENVTIYSANPFVVS